MIVNKLVLLESSIVLCDDHIDVEVPVPEVNVPILDDTETDLFSDEDTDDDNHITLPQITEVVTQIPHQMGSQVLCYPAKKALLLKSGWQLAVAAN